MSVARITWRQIQVQTPEDDRRREAIGGELYVTAAPTIRHQRVSRRLHRALLELLQEPGATTQARLTGTLPVRHRGDVVGEIDLDRVFARER